MNKVLRAASVAGLVLLSAVGCSHCCGSKTESAAAPCANGQCGTPTTTTRVMTPGTTGMTGTAMPTTMTTVPGRPPMMTTTTINQMPATAGSLPPAGGSNPMLLPQN